MVALSLLLPVCLTALPSQAVAQEVVFCGGEPATVADQAGDVFGSGGRDVIFADEFPAPAVIQTIYGLGGNDLICAGAGDVVYAGSGNDVVHASTTAAVHGEAGRDTLTAFSGIVSGGSGNDTLIDGAVATLLGGSGNDDLLFGAVCDGGSGRDSAEGCASTVNVP
jgi:Ca2+-binding RTX toxin-like protein